MRWRTRQPSPCTCDPEEGGILSADTHPTVYLLTCSPRKHRYVLDGNALGMTATEAWRRRDAVETNQPDYIVVSVGYPVSDSAYGAQRSIDFQPVTPGEDPPAVPGVREGADDFIAFIEGALRPFVREQALPSGVEFGREALYGHSFGGLFVVYALLRRPDLVDTFLAASPALYWNGHYILNHTGWLDEAPAAGGDGPAFRLAYGGLEQDAVRRRTETQEEFEARVELLKSFGLLHMGEECAELMGKIGSSERLRDAELKVYEGSDHASVGAVALTDGLDYFIDW